MVLSRWELQIRSHWWLTCSWFGPTVESGISEDCNSYKVLCTRFLFACGLSWLIKVPATGKVYLVDGSLLTSLGAATLR